MWLRRCWWAFRSRRHAGCSRFLQGTCAAMMFGTSTAMLTLVFPPRERGWVLGINMAATYTGLSVGPFIGGLMTQSFGSRWIFLLGVPLGVLVLPPVITRVKTEWADSRGERFDGGAIGYGIALARSSTACPGRPSLRARDDAAGRRHGRCLLGWERGTPQARLKWICFGTPGLRFFQPSRADQLQRHVGGRLPAQPLPAIHQALSPHRRDLCSSLSPLSGPIFAVGRPALRPHGAAGGFIGRHGLSTVGLALRSPGPPTRDLAHRGEPDSVGPRLRPLLVPNTNAVMGRWTEAPGVASATLATMRMIGLMLSLSISALIFSVVIGRVQITPEYYDAFLISVKLAFTIFTAACFGGIFWSGVWEDAQRPGGRSQGSGGSNHNRRFGSSSAAFSKRKRNETRRSWQASAANCLAGLRGDDHLCQ